MLIEFSVGNYLSFKEEVTFSMVSSSIREHKDTHVFQPVKNLKLLKSAAIYGANASGKSNLFKAMSFVSNFVQNSSKDSQAEEKINIERFKLSTETDKTPSFFQIIFLQDNTRYRYGFEVTDLEVKSEWLYSIIKNKEIELFERYNQDYIINPLFKEGKDLNKKTRANALFLSVVAQFNGDIAISILKWFKKFVIISGLQDTYQDNTKDLLEKDLFKDEFMKLIKIADIGIEDLKIKQRTPSLKFFDVWNEGELKVFLKQIKSIAISTLHKKYDDEKGFLGLEEFDLDKQESHGTQKLFTLLGPIIETLNNGKVLVVDEFDSRLHTLIARFLIGLFNSNERNQKNAQLIINTHDTNLLSNKIFRRDQIWFTEKTRYGASDLYSLVEYNKVRSDASFEKDYLLGRYGAIPFIGDFQFFKRRRK